MSVDRRYIQTDDPFIAEDLLQMELAPDYNNWIFELIKPFLGSKILEVGPGIGNISRLIAPCADVLVCVEPNISCRVYLKENLSAIKNFSIISKQIQDCSLTEFEDFDFDTILCVNVLEHIEDHLSVLMKFHQLLSNKGKIILYVPAVQAAYGPIDASIGHFRRYSITSINNLVIEAGFRIQYSSYSNFLGLIGWWYNAKVGKITKQNNSQIRIFNRIIPIIAYVEKIIPPPLGMSLISVGVK
jgi:SAM-dependent methyltransferase